MQVVYQNEDEGSNSGGVDLVDVIICIEEIGRYIKRKCIRELRRRIIGI